MHKLLASIQKDVRILLRDKVGLLFMFGMPLLLVLLVTAIQNSAFESAGSVRMPLLVYNRDTGSLSTELIKAIEGSGMFKVIPTADPVSEHVHAQEALAGIDIPDGFSAALRSGAKGLAGKALRSFGAEDTANGSAVAGSGSAVAGSGSGTAAAGSGTVGLGPLSIYEHPVLQESFRRGIYGTVSGALQMLESRLVLQDVYWGINARAMPDSVLAALTAAPLPLREVSIAGPRVERPNAAQHNVPAWTIFAMFFVVLSLGGSVVREKASGSFLRLKTLPTPFGLNLVSKQITYLGVTVLQAALIFTLGATLFVKLGLPPLRIPQDLSGLVLVTLLTGWCAVSYAICVGVWARTHEQVNGFGAISIIIFAVVGGLMVPGFVMPDGLRALMNASPLHWSLEAYYSLFLGGGRLWENILPLFIVTLALQGITWWGLRQRHLL